MLCCLGCSQPKRPTEVNSTAVWAESAKTGFWQVCTTTEEGGIHCTIWNKGGTVLLDERFLPLDGGPAPKSSDLRLRGGGPCTGPYQVCLANGRILLPQSMFEKLKAFIEGRKD
jgi:hypothetical protein